MMKCFQRINQIKRNRQDPFSRRTYCFGEKNWNIFNMFSRWLLKATWRFRCSKNVKHKNNTKIISSSQVSLIYKDQSIGNPISISVMNIVPIEKIFGARRTKGEGIAATDMLNKFCRWQQSNNPSASSPGHYDTALLLTRYIFVTCNFFV